MLALKHDKEAVIAYVIRKALEEKFNARQKQSSSYNK
jgi:hypothetical protein